MNDTSWIILVLSYNSLKQLLFFVSSWFKLVKISNRPFSEIWI